MAEKKRKPTRAEKKAAAKLQKDLRSKGKLADYKAGHARANTGGSAYCEKCDVWYDMNDWTQYCAHDHT